MSVKRFYIIYVAILPIFLLVFSFCKKYPEDHKISLQTAKKRLRAHQWFFSKLYINDADSTMTHLHNLIPNSNSTRDFSFMVFKGMNYKDDGGDIAYYFESNPNFAYPSQQHTSSINLNKKKTILKISGGFVDNYNQGAITPSTMNSIMYAFGTRGGENWEITKLTKTDLHIKTTFNNYEVKFEFVN